MKSLSAGSAFLPACFCLPSPARTMNTPALIPDKSMVELVGKTPPARPESTPSFSLASCLHPRRPAPIHPSERAKSVFLSGTAGDRNGSSRRSADGKAFFSSGRMPAERLSAESAFLPACFCLPSPARAMNTPALPDKNMVERDPDLLLTPVSYFPTGQTPGPTKDTSPSLPPARHCPARFAAPLLREINIKKAPSG